MKYVIYGLMMSIAFSSCIQKKQPSSAAEDNIGQTTTETKEISGNYADAGYALRSQGYDWVGVSFRTTESGQAMVKVRSRADKKRPACTFDAVVYQREDNSYYTSDEGKTIVFTFSGDTLRIAAEGPDAANSLYYYCSGGATLAGTYTRVDGALDESQVDKTGFLKTLNLQGIGFEISTMKEDGFNFLTVKPFGLEISNDPERTEIDGRVTGAEIEDLNSDGSPELLVYTQSTGSGSYGDVIGYSVNNKKSMSQVYFPPVADNDAINTGYMGHDEFAIVETYLVQRFPVYRENDVNANPTGGMRQISYKLVDGEALRRFEVHRVDEY
jgi:hypothetical protein